MIGRCLVLPHDTPLLKIGRPYPRLVLKDSVPPENGGPGKRVGVVAAGTRLRVVRAERGTVYSDGLFQITGDLAFGRIEDGDHAGKVVDLGWGWPIPTVLPRAGQPPDPYAPCDPGG